MNCVKLTYSIVLTVGLNNEYCDGCRAISLEILCLQDYNDQRLNLEMNILSWRLCS
jgi:hypothetical protein